MDTLSVGNTCKVSRVLIHRLRPFETLAIIPSEPFQVWMRTICEIALSDHRHRRHRELQRGVPLDRTLGITLAPVVQPVPPLASQLALLVRGRLNSQHPPPCHPPSLPIGRVTAPVHQT